MEKLLIQTTDLSISFSIDSIKLIISEDYTKVFKLIQTMKKVFNKVGDSDYDTENKLSKVEVNHREIDLKRNHFFIVTEHFDLEQDLKLSSKSIMLKYLETRLSNIEYNEITATINTLFQELSRTISEELCDSISKYAYFNLSEFNQKIILKNIEVSLLKEEVSAHPFNLSYDEMLRYQLYLIDQIAKGSPLITYWVVLSIPIMTNEVWQAVNVISKNLKIIVTSPKYEHGIISEHVLIVNNKFVDITDEVSIYEEIIMNYPHHIELQEMKEKLIDYAFSTDKSIHELNKFL